MEPLYGLLHDSVKCDWKKLKMFCQQIITTITKFPWLYLIQTIDFFFTVGSSLIDLGSFLFQVNNKGKLDVISHPSLTFTTKEKNSLPIIMN